MREKKQMSWDFKDQLAQAFNFTRQVLLLQEAMEPTCS